MSKLTKNQKLYNAKVEAGKAYTLEEAAALVKEITFTKFDASTDIDVRLGVDPRKANRLMALASRFASWFFVDRRLKPLLRKPEQNMSVLKSTSTRLRADGLTLM